MKTFEVTGFGFDGNTDQTDDRVFWVKAETHDDVRQAIAGTKAGFHDTIDAEDDSIDFHLPAQAELLRAKLLGFELNPREIVQNIQLQIISAEHGFDDFDVIGHHDIHRVTTGHNLIKGDVFNVYGPDGTKRGATWLGSLEPSLAAFLQVNPDTILVSRAMRNPLEKFEYQLLSRLQQDCEYYLGAGNRNRKHLWALNETLQVQKMMELYESLPEKPDWITLEAINGYQEKMVQRQESAGTDNNSQHPLYVRTIAEVLTKHLELSGTSVHWAQPAGGEVSWEPPKLTWPEVPFLGYMIDERSCEGTIVTVVHHESARGSAHGQELIKIKFLQGLKAVLGEVVVVVEFLNNMKTDDMLNLQLVNVKKRRH